MTSNYVFPCGVADPDGDEAWKCEIACIMTGCEACKNFNGTIYYQRNIAKGVAAWAKRELLKGGEG